MAAVVLLLAADAGAPAQQAILPGPLTADEQQRVNEAVEKGRAFLLKAQNPDLGTWGPPGAKVGQGGWAVGYTALAGLALVESGVDPTDPQIKKAAAFVRYHAPALDATYEVSLAVLFLDRMKDKRDVKLIQVLAARLIAAQTASGGWGYRVPKAFGDPARDPATRSFLTALRALNPPPANTPAFRERPGRLGLCIKTADDVRVRAAAGPDDPEKARKAAVARLEPPALRDRPVFGNIARLGMAEPQEGKRNDPLNAHPDNSNTHFALLALWAARKYDVPTERTYALLARRFRTSQGEGGFWGYDYGKPAQSGPMTCVALLALAIGHVLNIDQEAGAKLEQDPKVVSAFAALGKRVGSPVGRMEDRPPPGQVGGLYYLWALERIAVLYDVQQLSGKDWYRWGAEVLVASQQQDGSWADGGYHGENPVVNTCFALMFLKRANLTPDLSKKLVVDTTALAAPAAEPPPSAPEPPPETPEPEPAPTPEPVAVGPPPAPKAVEEPKPAEEPSTAPPPATKSRLPLLLTLLGVVVVGGIVAFFAVRLSRDEDDEYEKPRRKKKSVKRKARVAGDD